MRISAFSAADSRCYVVRVTYTGIVVVHILSYRCYKNCSNIEWRNSRPTEKKVKKKVENLKNNSSNKRGPVNARRDGEGSTDDSEL